MSYATANRRHRERRWVIDGGPNEIIAFGRVMVDVGHITDVDELQDYHEEPHKWSREHAWWDHNGRTADEDQWAQGEADRFET